MSANKSSTMMIHNDTSTPLEMNHTTTTSTTHDDFDDKKHMKSKRPLVNDEPSSQPFSNKRFATTGVNAPPPPPPPSGPPPPPIAYEQKSSIGPRYVPAEVQLSSMGGERQIKMRALVSGKEAGVIIGQKVQV